MAGGLIRNLALLLLAAPAAAHSAQDQGSPAVHQSFSADLVQSGFADLGYAYERYALRNGNPAWRVTTPDDGLIDVRMRACDEDRCRGLALYRYFDNGEYSDTDLARYHARFVFGRVYLDRRGRLTVQRYLISDGGVTAANLRANIEVFADISSRIPMHIANLRASAAAEAPSD